MKAGLSGTCTTTPLLPKFANVTVKSDVSVPDGDLLIGGKIRLNCNGGQTAETCAKCDVACTNGCCNAAHCETCTATAASRLPAGNMPGCASFLCENNRELAACREQLARDLVSYLTRGNHNPEHVRQVLLMSLESAANDAHRAAMASCNQPGINVAPVSHAENRHPGQHASIEHLCALIEQQQRRMDRMEEGMFAMARRLGEQQESGTASAPERFPDVVRLPMPMPVSVAGQSASQEVQVLRQRVAQLESQLQMVKGQNPFAHPNSHAMPGGTLGDAANSRIPHSPAMQSGSQQTLQPATWNSIAEPARETSSVPPGNPSVRLMPMVKRTYYVGDLMSPPFASGTLKLMQVIKTAVDPESWDHASMEIVAPSVSLLITQTEENHARIEKLLESMKATPLNR